MFTGLIQETGQIASVRQVRGKTRITVNAKSIPAELKLGDSVAVSGACLTAVESERHRFSCDLAEETLKRTSLGNLKKNSTVNLELPTQANARLGGHVVQGHVDGVGKLLSLEKIKGREDWRLVIEIPSELERYVVPQGSITVEGISLTVAHIKSNQIEIAIIPHTYRATNLNTLKRNGLLNIEVDVLAKYAEKSTPKKLSTVLSVPSLIRRGF